VSLAQGETRTIEHGIGGDPDDYVVDMQLRNDTAGRHILYLGGESLVLSSQSQPRHLGAYWRNLVSDSITVRREDEDPVADQLRVRIWLIR